jgi:uncharacterized protein (DUF983 family)
MIFYWVLFLIPACVALIENKKEIDPRTGSYDISFDIGIFFWMLFITLAIGLRHGVGGDWLNYVIIYYDVIGVGFNDLFAAVRDDPLYNIINWFAANNNLGLHFVNVVCAFFFALGLTIFCQNLPRPWLGLTIAVPYLVIVVSMGYTRQAMALGLAFFGLVALARQRVLLFTFFIILAILAHKSAILLLPIAGLAATKNRLFIIFYFLAIGLIGYFLFIEASIEYYIEGYINQDYQSQGALIRLTMNEIPSFLFLMFFSKFNLPQREVRLWFWISLFSIFLFLLFPIFPSSSALDRIALYLLPVQIAVFAYFADDFARSPEMASLVRILIIGYYAAVQFIWLNFAANSSSWVPYVNVLWAESTAL